MNSCIPTNISKRSRGLEDLICSMLRGPHTKNLPATELRLYIQLAGVALHNIPHYVSNEERLPLHQLLSVNDLDPQASGNGWGLWILSLCDAFSQEPPTYPQDHEPQISWST